MKCATTILVLLGVASALGCDRKKGARDQIASEATVRASATNIASATSTTSATSAASVPLDRGPAPAGAGASKEAREQAVLDLLAGGSPGIALPVAAVDQGKSFDRWLRDRLAPRVEESAATDDAALAGDGRVARAGEPICRATAGGAGVSGGAVPNAAAAVARMRGRFRACCQQGMKSNPNMGGSVVLVAKIGPNGEVQAVSGGGGSIAPIVPCLKAVVTSGGFAPPEGGSASISIPITFVKE